MYALAEIEKIIVRGLEYYSSGDYEAAGKELKTDFLVACSKVEELLKEAIVAEGRKNYLRRFFQGHQLGLVRIIGLLDSRERSTELSLDVLLTSFKERLYDLLLFVQTEVPDYFNDGLVAPLDWRRSVLENISAGMAMLREVSTRPYIDEDLFSLVIRPIENMVTARDLNYTFHFLGYMEFLQRRLINFQPSVSEGTLAKQELMRLLLSVNYNSSDFIQYCTKHIEARLAVTDTLVDRIDNASYYYKVMNQVDVLPGVAFDKSRPTAREQVSEWIAAELDFLRQQRILQLSCPPTDEMVRGDFKLDFNLSVSHLAYLTRAFVETGVIQNRNTSELARFLSKFAKTKKSEAISYDSFRIKFYNVESGTKDAVRKMLQMMLQYMNKN